MPAEITLFAEPLEDWLKSEEGRRALSEGSAPSPSGTPLRSILAKQDEDHNYRLYVGGRFRDQLRHVANLTGDNGLANLAERGYATVSVAHLLHLDPDTKIRNGMHIKYTEEQSRIMSRHRLQA